MDQGCSECCNGVAGATEMAVMSSGRPAGEEHSMHQSEKEARCVNDAGLADVKWQAAMFRYPLKSTIPLLTAKER